MRNEIKTSPIPKHSRKLSWKNTASEMARDDESWKDFKNTVDDGLDHLSLRALPFPFVDGGREMIN
jgi:hypothetical protein